MTKSAGNSVPLLSIAILLIGVNSLLAQKASSGPDLLSPFVESQEQVFNSKDQRYSEAPNAQQKLRQGLLLAGMTTTTIGYGLFSMKYNSWRATSEDSRQLYLQDVQENAVLYTQTNQELDEIQSFKSWESDYQSALVWRERAARAGLLTGLIAIITVLDAAVTWQGPSSDSLMQISGSDINIQPILSSGLKGFKTSINF